MKTKIFKFTGCDKPQLPAILWLSKEEPEALIQLTHGMTEHKVRCRLKMSGQKVVDFRLMEKARHTVLHEEKCGAAGNARAMICRWVMGPLSQAKR